ncbi:MAG TPA: LytTR family DNA-binding domain-containing protein [Pyrinomonadaceae bacterium]|nr:LytTR family DNA-binding domain-containing protein [Pyrinomonadaceae bacterium]
MHGDNEITVLIVDDEPLARRGVRQLLARHEEYRVLGEARHGREAVEKICALKPDLVFLDIQMPDMDGFEVLAEVGPTDLPMVIFVTAYDQFAVRAFETHAVDYLVKPLQVRRFEEALTRTRVQKQSGDAVALAQKLTALLQEKRKPTRLRVPTSTGELLLELREIDWIEADDYYSAVHVGDKKHLIRESLTSLDDRLGSDRFLRVHRSAIVNLERIRELRNDGGESVLILRDGSRVPVSRRRREQVNQILRKL